MGVVGDGDVQQIFHRGDRQTRATSGRLVHFTQLVSLIDFMVAEVGNLDPQVPGDGEQAPRTGFGVESCQDHRVGSRRSLVADPIAVVQAQQQQVDPAGAIPGLRLRAVFGLQRFV